MPQNTQGLDGNAIAAILGGIGAVLTAVGIPKIFENWKQIREMKYSKILNKLDETKKELAEVKKELYSTKDQLKKVSTIVSVVLPLIKLKSQDDPEALELIKIFERESGINLTPTIDKEDV